MNQGTRMNEFLKAMSNTKKKKKKWKERIKDINQCSL